MPEAITPWTKYFWVNRKKSMTGKDSSIIPARVMLVLTKCSWFIICRPTTRVSRSFIFMNVDGTRYEFQVPLKLRMSHAEIGFHCVSA
jgi:hypothetical protein